MDKFENLEVLLKLGEKGTKYFGRGQSLDEEEASKIQKYSEAEQKAYDFKDYG